MTNSSTVNIVLNVAIYVNVYQNVSGSVLFCNVLECSNVGVWKSLIIKECSNVVDFREIMGACHGLLVRH